MNFTHTGIIFNKYTNARALLKYKGVFYMNFDFSEVKIARISIDHDLFQKLRVGNLIYTDGRTERIILHINEKIVAEVSNRKAKPDIERNKSGKPNLLLGRPVIVSLFNEHYYDEDVTQFYLQAQFAGYNLVLVGDKNDE